MARTKEGQDLSDLYTISVFLFHGANSFQLDADEAYFKGHNEPPSPSRMIGLSAEDVERNTYTTAKYLEGMTPMKQRVEREIDITGGEESGVNDDKPPSYLLVA